MQKRIITNSENLSHPTIFLKMIGYSICTISGNAIKTSLFILDAREINF